MEKDRHEAIKEHRKKMAEVIARAAGDEAFKKRFISEPREVLDEYGIDFPEDLKIEVVEQTDTLSYVVIPFKPEGMEGGSWQCGDDCWDLPCIRCS